MNCYRRNRKKRRGSGVHCSRCAKPTGKPGACDRCAAYVRQWKKQHPEAVYAAKHKRKDEGRDTRGRFLAELLEKQKGRCVMCGVKSEKWHIDHIIPVAIGGCSERFNLQALCPFCNMSKGAKIIDRNQNNQQFRLVQ